MIGRKNVSSDEKEGKEKEETKKKKKRKKARRGKIKTGGSVFFLNPRHLE